MDKIQVPQTGARLDSDLKSILTVLENAAENEGKVLYIRNGKIDFISGDAYFDVTPLT